MANVSNTDNTVADAAIPYRRTLAYLHRAEISKYKANGTVAGGDFVATSLYRYPAESARIDDANVVTLTSNGDAFDGIVAIALDVDLLAPPFNHYMPWTETII